VEGEVLKGWVMLVAETQQAPLRLVARSYRKPLPLSIQGVLVCVKVVENVQVGVEG